MSGSVTSETCFSPKVCVLGSVKIKKQAPEWVRNTLCLLITRIDKSWEEQTQILQCCLYVCFYTGVDYHSSAAYLYEQSSMNKHSKHFQDW